MTLSARSLKNLEGVHPDLVRVVKRAAEIEPFIVTQGLRTLAEQKENIAKGVSWSLASRHLTGHAVDLCDPDGCYDLPDMIRIGKAMRKAASEANVAIRWGALRKHGGDWTTRNDTPHFELDAKVYPANPGIPMTETVKQAASVAVSPKAVGGAVAGSAAVALPSIPAPPDIESIRMWRTTAEQVSDLLVWAADRPITVGACVAWVLVMTFLPRFTWSRSS